MPKGYPPTIFVSSTCYDLGQVRADLKEFLFDLGLEPLLSETSSFPVNPQTTPFENCIDAVKERADIFLLIVGARYGAQTTLGKSITNLEYLAAKAKGIPTYIFVSKAIIHSLPIWRSNRTGNFDNVVDSVKLFEFVEQLRGSEEHWVYPFEQVKDIMDTLRQQLAHLFMDSLVYREKFKSSHLPEALSDLSGKCLKFVIEKPRGWEYHLFANILTEEITRLRHLKWDLSYSIKIGRTNALGNLQEVSKWIGNKLHEITLLTESAESLMNVALQEAMGPPGVPANPEHLVYVARRVSHLYKAFLEWTIEFNLTRVESDFEKLVRLHTGYSQQVIEEIESMATRILAEVEKAEAAVKGGGKYSGELRFKFILPENKELMEEVARLKQRIMISSL